MIDGVGELNIKQMVKAYHSLRLRSDTISHICCVYIAHLKRQSRIEMNERLQVQIDILHEENAYLKRQKCLLESRNLTLKMLEGDHYYQIAKLMRQLDN